jgi:hypothetical protein
VKYVNSFITYVVIVFLKSFRHQLIIYVWRFKEVYDLLIFLIFIQEIPPSSSFCKRFWYCTNCTLYMMLVLQGQIFPSISRVIWLYTQGLPTEIDCWPNRVQLMYEADYSIRYKYRSFKCIAIYLHSIYTISQQMHCSDSLLISYSSYMFRCMYVIIREPSCMCPAELLY